MTDEHEYSYDKSMLTSVTVGRIIDLANKLALHIAPTRRKLCPAIKELEILNNDHKKAMETIVNISRKRRRGRKV